MNILHTPITENEIKKMNVGDMLYVSGDILCGRDMVLPQIVKLIREARIEEAGLKLQGALIFHSAVSDAGIGPTSSNKIEIESSIIPLAEAGVKIHLGKGRISRETIDGLNRCASAYAVVPPVTALLGKCVRSKSVICFPEFGMEAFFKIFVEKMPILVAAVNGRDIYERQNEDYKSS